MQLINTTISWLSTEKNYFSWKRGSPISSQMEKQKAKKEETKQKELKKEEVRNKSKSGLGPTFVFTNENF